MLALGLCDATPIEDADRLASALVRILQDATGSSSTAAAAASPPCSTAAASHASVHGSHAPRAGSPSAESPKASVSSTPSPQLLRLLQLVMRKEIQAALALIMQSSTVSYSVLW